MKNFINTILTKKVKSFIPFLYYESGHPLAYHLAVGEACKLNGWQHEVFVPLSCPLKLPSNWYFVLASHIPTPPGEKNPKKRLSDRLREIFGSIPYFMRAMKGSSEGEVFFLEQFTLNQLVSFFLAYRLARSHSSVWLLYRQESKSFRSKIKTFKLLHKFFGKKLTLFTDSDLLAQDLEVSFKRKFSILPIPHTHLSWEEKGEKERVECWWPGAFTSEGKGLRIMAGLQEDVRYTVLVAKSAEKHLKQQNVSFVETDLSREGYAKLMNRVDLILLPYDPKIYAKATSGIFVEAIIAKKVVAVSDQTWMAHELRRFGLEELIVDWSHPRLYELSQNRNIQERLQRMQEEYELFHNVSHFAKALQWHT